MERQAQYLNKFIVTIWVGILVLTLYISARSRTVPDKWVKSNDKGLTHLNGYIYYNEEVFSGWLYENYTNGNRAMATPFFEGKEEGIMRTWYPDSRPEQERLYSIGKKEGTHKGWWHNGKPKFKYVFENDEHNGTATEWFDNGKLCRVFTYRDGHEDGLQRMWWADGNLRANYIVKNGKQYGLIGRKLCKNIFVKNEKI